MLATYTLTLYVISLIASSLIINKCINSPPQESRNKTVDGLRGILATMVVLFHFLATYNIEVYGRWSPPANAPLSNTGSIPVVLFFMISGYLFFKTIEKKEMGWGRFFFFRVIRIYPLYFFVILAVFAISYFLGLNNDFSSILSWLFFVGAPAFGFKESFLINAGVQWTLLYEAIFYISLPLVWSVRNKRWSAYVILSLAVGFIAFYLYETHKIKIELFFPFFIGFMCNYLSDKKKVLNNSKLIGWAGVVCLLFSFLFTSAYSYFQFLLLGVSFLAVVVGSGVFGFLKNKYLISVGDTSYSIYMTHGLILFLLFRVGIVDIKGMSELHFAPFIIIVMIIVSLLSSFTYLYIEKPFLEIAKIKKVDK